MRNRIVSAAEAAELIADGDTVATSGFVGIGVPEALLVAEVNLDLLRTLHEHGTVTTLKDRLPGLYELRWKGPNGPASDD